MFNHCEIPDDSTQRQRGKEASVPEKENLKSTGEKKTTLKQNNTKSQALLVARSSESLSEKGKPKSRDSRVQ